MAANFGFNNLFCLQLRENDLRKKETGNSLTKAMQRNGELINLLIL